MGKTLHGHRDLEMQVLAEDNKLHDPLFFSPQMWIVQMETKKVTAEDGTWEAPGGEREGLSAVGELLLSTTSGPENNVRRPVSFNVPYRLPPVPGAITMFQKRQCP